MIDMLVKGPLVDVSLRHVRMAFSDDIDSVGKLQISKILHLVSLIVQIVWMKLRFNPAILYYPPAGPKKVPLFRDTILLLATRWMFSRTVFHFQASGVSELIAELPSWLSFFVRRALFNPDASIQLSDLTVPDPAYIRSRHIYTIPNASEDHAISRLGAKESHRIPEEPVRLLYLGTVCEQKGVLVLLQALAKAIGTGVKAHLDIVGACQPTEFGAAVTDTIQQLSIASHVTLHGQKTGEDKWNLFAEADAFCFPTHYESEGFPVVLVEAMSFGLPVLSTFWRGIPSIVIPGENGYLVARKDVDDFASKICLIARDSDLRAKLGRESRKRFIERYTKEKHLESMSRVFQDVAK
jgi:glycosyltransferase involved in cell wall biosynthesis